MKRTLLPPLIEDIVNFFKNTQFHSLNCLSEPDVGWSTTRNDAPGN